MCGVNHKGIQRKLLAEAGLTYERAYSLALSVETSERDAKALQSENPADPPLLVHHVSPPAPSSPPPGTSKHSLYSSTGADKNSKPLITCYRCGGPHLAPQCSHLNTVCRFCQKTGHLARVCRRRGKTAQGKGSTEDKDSKAHYVSESSSEQGEEYAMFPVTSPSSDPYRIAMTLDGVLVSMDVDTGAALTVINQLTYERLLERAEQGSRPCQLVPSGKLLKSYSGHAIPVLGTMQVEARYRDKGLVLPVYIVTGGGPNLLGRDWLSHFEVDLALLQAVTSDGKLDSILETYSAVFSDELGCVPGPQ